MTERDFARPVHTRGVQRDFCARLAGRAGRVRRPNGRRRLRKRKTTTTTTTTTDSNNVCCCCCCRARPPVPPCRPLKTNVIESLVERRIKKKRVRGEVRETMRESEWEEGKVKRTCIYVCRKAGENRESLPTPGTSLLCVLRVAGHQTYGFCV